MMDELAYWAEDAMTVSRPGEQEAAATQRRHRIRLADDLHDGVMADLHAIVMAMEHHEEGLPQVRAWKGRLAGTVQSLREIVAGMHDDIAHTQLPALIAERYSERWLFSGVPSLFVWDHGWPADLQQDVVREWLRMAEECLSNVVRHAGAAEVRVHLGVRGGGPYLHVTDNGKGLEHTRSTGDAGFGLRSIARRASEVGARLSWRAVPGGGTAISLASTANRVA
jgi:signal transduction histidine kinase